MVSKLYGGDFWEVANRVRFGIGSSRDIRTLEEATVTVSLTRSMLEDEEWSEWPVCCIGWLKIPHA